MFAPDVPSADRPIVDVIVPARDQAASLGAVLTALPMRMVRSVVVVDYGSADGTAQIARDAGAVVLREAHGGYGAACQRAVAHLTGLPTPPEAVVFMSGDGSDDPADLAVLIEPLYRDNAELVLGVRERRGKRGAQARVTLGLISALYRHKFEDVGPFRAIRVPALVALAMSDNSNGWNVEMQVKAVKLGLHIVEVPVVGRVLTARDEDGLVDSALSTSRVLFRILRNATTR